MGSEIPLWTAMISLWAKHRTLPEEVEWALGEGDYMAQDVQLPADGAESRKFGLFHELIQIVVFPVPQYRHLEWVNIQNGCND